MAIAIVGCLLLGAWGDAELGTSPWLTLLGLALGCFLGFRSLWQLAKSSAAEEDDDGC